MNLLFTNHWVSISPATLDGLWKGHVVIYSYKDPTWLKKSQGFKVRAASLDAGHSLKSHEIKIKEHEILN